MDPTDYTLGEALASGELPLIADCPDHPTAQIGLSGADGPPGMAAAICEDCGAITDVV